MFLKQSLKQSFLVALLSLGTLCSTQAAVESGACGVGSDACLESCTRFNQNDARFKACNNVCRKQSARCDAPAAPMPERSPERSPEPSQEASQEPPQETAQALTPDSTQEAAQEPAQESVETTELSTAQATPMPAPNEKSQLPTVASLATKKAMLKELEKNTEMLVAIKSGNLNAIRRLIEVQGLNPTYVFGYEYNPQTRQFDGKVTRLRLSDVFADANTLRNDSAGLDRILALFLELGMDVKATLPMPAAGVNTTAPQRETTAWGPSLRLMETARDREARLRAFEMALQAGLVPDDGFSDWLFAELTQVCGRDRSKFSIQIVDLLLKYLGPSLGPSLQDPFWRNGTQGPETIADVLDLSFAPPQPKTPREKAAFALQDDMWEQCVPLSRRVNRFLMQGN